MKKIFKCLLLTLLVAAMLLNTCGIVLANNTIATFNVSEKPVDEAAGIKMLQFSAILPANASFAGTSIAFSWDNTIIQPVNSKTHADVKINEESTSKAKTNPLKAFENDDYAFSFAPVMVVVDGNRTGMLVDTYSEDEFTPEGEVVFTEFYFRTIDGKSADSETFKIESEYVEGSMLKKFYEVNSGVQAIQVGDYKYADATEGATDTAKIGTIEYTGSTIPVFGSVEIDAVDSITVPTVYEDGKATGNTAEEVQLTAKAYSTKGGTMDMPVGAKWEIVGTAPEGVALSQTGLLTVQPGAMPGEVTVKITADGESDEFTFSIKREALALAAIVVKADGNVVDGEYTVVKPANLDSAPVEVKFTAAAYDQYGSSDGLGTVALSTADNQDGLTFDPATGILTVTGEAADNATMNIEASIDGEMVDSVCVTVVGLDVDWSGVSVVKELTYGEKTETAFTYPATGVAKVGDAEYNGKYSIDGGDLELPANKDGHNVYAVFTVEENEAYGDYSGKKVYSPTPYTVIVNKADIDMSGVVFANKTETYTGNAIEIEVKNLPDKLDATVTYEGLAEGEKPVNASRTAYKAKATFTVKEAYANNYNVPAAMTAELVINPATAEITTEKDTYDATYTGEVVDIEDLFELNHNEATISFAYERIGDAPAKDSVATYGASGGGAATGSPSTPGATPSNRLPVDAGVYKVTATAIETANYTAAEKVVTLIIYKADVTEYVVSETDSTKAEFDVTKTALEVSTAGVTSVEALAGYLPECVYAAFEGGVEDLDVTWTTEDEWNAKEGEYTFTAVFPENGNLIFKPLEATIKVTKVVGTITSNLPIKDKTVAKERVEALNDEEPSFADLDLPYSITVTYPTAGEPGSAEFVIVWNKTVADLKAAAATVTNENNAEVDLTIADATFTPEGHADFSWITIESGNKMTLTITNRLPVDVEITMVPEMEYSGEPISAATAIQKELEDGIDETVGDLAPYFTYFYTGKTANGEDYSGENVPKDAGSYKVTATLNSETHSGSSSADFVITAKPVTANVKAESKVYGDDLPTFVLENVVGLLDGDDLGAEFKTTATKDSDVGTYDVELKDWSNKNYALAADKGTLKINKKEITEVPVITDDVKVGSELTATVDIADKELDFQWYVAGKPVVDATAKTYTPVIADSNKEITVKITAKAEGNYSGGTTSEAKKVDKYTVTGTIAIDWETDNGLEGPDGIINTGDVLKVDTADIANYEELVNAGLAFDYSWKLDGAEVGTDETYTIEATEGVITVEVKTGDDSNFICETIAANAVEIGKMPVTGSIELAEADGKVSIKNTISGVEGTDYDLIWTIGEDNKNITAEVVNGVYTIKAGDYGKTITVTVVLKEDGDYTGVVAPATEVVDPIAPTIIEITTTTTTDSITATVTADANASDITKYTIEIDGVEGATYTGAENTATITGLNPGTTYTVKATAKNGVGTSAVKEVEATTVIITSSKPRPTYKPSTTPSTGNEGTGSEGEGTTTPEADVTVKVEDTSATVKADVIKDNKTVAVSTETESGTAVTTTVNVADANVASLEVSTKDSDKAAAGVAAEGAVGTPVEVKVDAKDAEGNKADVTVDVAIPAEEKAYAYIIDENGVATRTDSVYNEETGEVEVANVPDGAVVMLSTTAPATFDDSAEHWAEDTINYAVDAGIMNGVGGSTFDPDGKATRGMVNAMMVRLAKVAGVEFAEAADQKVDTDTAHWAAATDLIALANGWSTGVRTLEDGTVVMDTDATVTREQLVTMLWRFVGNPEAEGEITSFDDHADTAEWAKDAKAWAVGAGIINGKPGNKLDPNGTATRAEIATMFNRLMKFMTK